MKVASRNNLCDAGGSGWPWPTPRELLGRKGRVCDDTVGHDGTIDKVPAVATRKEKYCYASRTCQEFCCWFLFGGCVTKCDWYLNYEGRYLIHCVTKYKYTLLVFMCSVFLHLDIFTVMYQTNAHWYDTLYRILQFSCTFQIFSPTMMVAIGWGILMWIQHVLSVGICYFTTQP